MHRLELRIAAATVAVTTTVEAAATPLTLTGILNSPCPQGSFVDRHLEMQQQRAGDSGSVFSSRLGMDNLRGALWDLFFAGTDTSATFIEWAVIFLMKYPEVQERMHKEIKEQLGSRYGDGELLLRGGASSTILEVKGAL